VAHVATPTVEDLMRETGHLVGGHCKNLMVKGKKKSRTRANDTRLWLIVALHDTHVDMKKLSKSLGYKDAMRMVKAEVLEEKLGVVQGEVSPLALTNNAACDVQVIFDAKMMEQEMLWFHPLTMEASTGMKPTELMRWIELSGRSVEIVALDKL
jgi:Ala-tRNA(Pro) deacylase